MLCVVQGDVYMLFQHFYYARNLSFGFVAKNTAALIACVWEAQGSA